MADNVQTSENRVQRSNSRDGAKHSHFGNRTEKANSEASSVNSSQRQNGIRQKPRNGFKKPKPIMVTPEEVSPYITIDRNVFFLKLSISTATVTFNPPRKISKVCRCTQMSMLPLMWSTVACLNHLTTLYWTEWYWKLHSNYATHPKKGYSSETAWIFDTSAHYLNKRRWF